MTKDEQKYLLDAFREDVQSTLDCNMILSSDTYKEGVHKELIQSLNTRQLILLDKVLKSFSF